jgi:hypothetical protein
MSDLWAFGWTQLLTIVGFMITISIAVGGFRTFERWRREKLEERRIEIALDALTIAYETKFIFQHIRGVMAYGYEWADMPERPGDTEEKRNRRGPFYAALKRINANKEFFDRVWHVQPRCMAVFGPHVEATFLKLHQARRHIEVAAQMLADKVDEPYETGDESTRKLYQQMRRDVWDQGTFDPEKERVGKMLTEFVEEIVVITQPVIEGQYRGIKSPWWSWK